MSVLCINYGDYNSILSMAIMIEQKYEVVPFNILHDSNKFDSILRNTECLNERYGKNIAEKSIFCKSMYTAKRYMESAWTIDLTTMSEQFPNIPYNQIHCICCRVATYIHAIACCKAKGYENISDPVFRNESSFVNSMDFMLLLNNICKANKIELHTPLFLFSKKSEVEEKISERQIDDLVHIRNECMFDTELNNYTTEQHIKSLTSFFITIIAPHISKDIGSLIPVYENM